MIVNLGKSQIALLFSFGNKNSELRLTTLLHTDLPPVISNG